MTNLRAERSRAALPSLLLETLVRLLGSAPIKLMKDHGAGQKKNADGQNSDKEEGENSVAESPVSARRLGIDVHSETPLGTAFYGRRPEKGATAACLSGPAREEYREGQGIRYWNVTV
jgi:hypothetical protein